MERKMKQHLAKLIIIVLAAFMLLPALTHAANEPRLRLALTEPSLKLNQQTTVEVRVEDATAVYGMELRLRFDPEKLEVITLAHGDFLSADPDNQAFVLQNEADNESGTVSYALSLLNPAPPVAGNGLLLQVTFQAKAEGQTEIQFEQGLFGTQTGEEIAPLLENAVLTIGEGALPAVPQTDQPAAEPRPIKREVAGTDNSTLLGLSLVLGGVLLAGLGLVVVAILAGVWFWFSRSKRPKNAPRRPVD
jgi:general secretion pathway protein D